MEGSGLPMEEEAGVKAWVGITSESRPIDYTGPTQTPGFPLKVNFLNKSYVTAYLSGFLPNAENFQHFKVPVSWIAINQILL